MRLGAICRDDNGGLGIQTTDFYKNMNPAKTIVVSVEQYKEYPERYPDGIFVKNPPSDGEIIQFLDGLDAVWVIEAPYNFNLFDLARDRGVKTILQPNYEWLPEPMPGVPDLYVCPSTWYFDNMPTPKVQLPNPVNRQVLPFKQKQTCDTFLHIAGHQGGYGRNGTAEILQALKHTNKDFKLIIYSQEEGYKLTHPIYDSRVEVRKMDVPDYWDLYHEGDVLLYPRRYGGLSLQIDEAMSCGMPVLMTDMEPQKGFLPKEWLIPAADISPLRIHRMIEMATVDPLAIAAKINQWIGRDIAEDSRIADQIAASRSWEAIKPRYLAAIENLLGA